MYSVSGVLYNWPAVMNGEKENKGSSYGVRGICPEGWHVPGDQEWEILSGFAGGESTAGSSLKETGWLTWINPNTGASNRSGFTGRPGGTRLSGGTFEGYGLEGLFWSASESSESEAWLRSLNNLKTSFSRLTGNKQNGYSVRCVKDVVSGTLPSVITGAISNIIQIITGGGNVTSDGGSPVTHRGICWNTTGAPTTANNKTIDGLGTGTFVSNMADLSPGTTYNVRAYAVNSQGTAYGNQVTFSTLMVLNVPIVLTSPKYPTNNSLVWDCIHESHRLLSHLKEEITELSFIDYTRKAKQNYFKINMIKKKDTRYELFCNQVILFTKVINQTSNVIKKNPGTWEPPLS